MKKKKSNFLLLCASTFSDSRKVKAIIAKHIMKNTTEMTVITLITVFCVSAFNEDIESKSLGFEINEGR